MAVVAGNIRILAVLGRVAVEVPLRLLGDLEGVLAGVFLRHGCD